MPVVPVIAPVELLADHLDRRSLTIVKMGSLTLMIIFLLLYLNFRNFAEAVIVMLALPFAIVGLERALDPSTYGGQGDA